ncbi:MAG: hypothetical protein OXN83_05910 [Oligoflexia bacterium]|nr:hypothetical protein [Oligoflexia bacterium]
MVEELNLLGVNIHAKTNSVDSETALDIAVKNNKLEIVKYLRSQETSSCKHSFTKTL